MKNKDSKARMQIIFGILLFTLILSGELYTMINYPKLYIVVIVLAVVDLVCLYIVINGLMVLQEQKRLREEEQYESIFKSQKASYLMLKKYFEEIEDKLNYLEAAAKVPTEEIVNAQKGIAKVIINRNRENTEALMNSYELVMEQFEQFKERISSITNSMDANRNEIIAAQKNSEEINEKTLQIKLQDVTVAMKDMELRINNAIMQSQKVITQTAAVMQPPVIQAPVHTDVPQVKNLSVEPEPQEEMPVVDELSVTESELEFEPEAEIGVESEIELEPIEEESEIELEPIVEEEPEIELEPIEVEPEIELEPIVEEEPEIELEPIEEESEIELEPIVEEEPEIKLEQAAEEEPEIDLQSETDLESGSQLELDLEVDTEPVTEAEPISESALAEENPPMPDLSDPNKTLSADEISALFANMSQDVGADLEPEPIPDPEPVQESALAEENPPMPDLSDPNKALSADEIAALFASMGA